MRSSPPCTARRRRTRLAAVVCALAAALAPARLRANSPGGARRLGGPEAQGPASPSLTALHHNPALITRLTGLSVLAVGGVGLDHLRVRRAALAESQPLPTEALRAPVNLFDPTGDYFLGLGYTLDPFAVAAGVYTLGTRTRIDGHPALRFQHLGDPDFGCGAAGGADCPAVGTRTAPTYDLRHDISIALAYNLLDRVQFGVAAHLPFLSTGFARDEDRALASQDPAALSCDGLGGVDLEDPRCAERLSFQGRNRLRWFGLAKGLSTRLDLALTFGVSFDIARKVTVGMRYRTRPLVNGGRLNVAGAATVCLPAGAQETTTQLVEPCAEATPVAATMSVPLPRELALGVSAVLPTKRPWRIDTQLVWRDLCPGGPGLARCQGEDARSLEILGLAQDTFIPASYTIYRGAVDQFGVEIWLHRDLVRSSKMSAGRRGAARSTARLSLDLGSAVYSPGTRPAALTPMTSDGWLLGGSAGMGVAFNRGAGTLHITPGYALDVALPARAMPGMQRPDAAIANAAAGGDLNGPGSTAVLEARARPTNAGSYSGSLHMLTLSIRWSERRADR